MKQLLKQYAAYNLWANQKMTEMILPLSEEQLQQEIISSFTSIYKTVLHAWGAEYIWYVRMLRLPQENLLPLRFQGTASELCDQIIQQSARWNEWMKTVNEDELLKNLDYTNLAGEAFRQPIYLLVQHVFNHNTFHRGQLITMLRQVGVTSIASTDFTTFTRMNIES